VQWGGDPQADWGGLAASIRGMLSWAASGSPFYATDIGGFYGDQPDAELFVRWCQAAVFASHMRFHGIGDRAPWSYGGAAERAVMEALRLRYCLLPYLWRTLEEAVATGLPVQRAMPLAFPDDPAAWAFEEQFLFGPDLLVAPVLRADGALRFYLPHGRWHHLLNGRVYEGGRTHSERLALDEVAVFAREGAEIPIGPAVEHTGELGREPVVEEVRRFG
jgi:alpha-D-xyloside xylohydrolase